MAKEKTTNKEIEYSDTGFSKLVEESNKKIGIEKQCRYCGLPEDICCAKQAVAQQRQALISEIEEKIKKMHITIYRYPHYDTDAFMCEQEVLDRNKVLEILTNLREERNERNKI